MGFGKLKKAVGGELNAIPVVRDIAKISPFHSPTYKAKIARLAQEKAIASESARLQEEEARKRTLFAGTALGATAERKKLLGL